MNLTHEEDIWNYADLEETGQSLKKQQAEDFGLIMYFEDMIIIMLFQIHVGASAIDAVVTKKSCWWWVRDSFSWLKYSYLNYQSGDTIV